MSRHPSLCLAAVLTAVPVLRGQDARPEEGRFAVPGAIARIISKDFRELDNRRRHLEAELSELPATPQNEQGTRVGWKIFGYGAGLPEHQWVEIDLGHSHRIDAIALIPVDAPMTPNTEPGNGFPRRFRVEVGDDRGLVTVIADFTAADFPNPGTLPVYLPMRGTMARRVRVLMNKSWNKQQQHAYALGEIMVLQGNRNLPAGLSGVVVRASNSLESRPAWSRDNLVDGQSTIGVPLRASARSLAHGWESASFPDPTKSTWVRVDLGTARQIDEVRLTFPRIPHYSVSHGYGFPGRLRIEVAEDSDFETGRVLSDLATRSWGNPAYNPITVPGDGLPARYVRVSADDLWQSTESRHVFALAELQVYQGDHNVALDANVTADGISTFSNNFKTTFLTDGLRGLSEFIEWPEWLEKLSRRREVLLEIGGVRAKLEAMQPALMTALTWSSSAALTLLFVVSGLLVLRARRIQARTVAELQRRIAGDLHDEIGSNLACIAMLTELSQRQTANIPAEDVNEIRRLASESAAAMRDIVWLIQPGPHDAPQLADRLRAAARRLLAGIEWEFEITGLITAPPLGVQRHLLLALKEMLHNVLHHAGAHQVRIRLVVQDEHFTLEARDDGCGFDAAGQSDGHGFTSLRHRAGLLGGTLVVESTSGQGTRVALSGAFCPPIKRQIESA